MRKKMIYSGMGEYADSYQGSGDVPNIRTVPRAPSRELLNQVHKFAAMRADELYNPEPIKGGFVHRPKLYRGVGAGMSKDESDGYFEGGKFGLTKQQGDAFFKGTKFITQPVKALGAIASMTPLAPYALPITVGMSAYEQLVKSLSGNGMGKKPKKVKGGQSKSDGRTVRAQIVRKVMNDRGVSMIEASKIVKKEGLY
jgi:hypothetical protein